MASSSAERKYLARIENSLEIAGNVAGNLAPHTIDCALRQQVIRDTELRISQVLRETLLGPGEGWLCEEDVDDPVRLGCEVVWVVDPVDGTKELINGLAEWSISVGLVIGGIPLAGGVYNPMTRELFLGSLNLGVTYNRQPVRAGNRTSLEGAVVLASRQEFIRGEWARFQDRKFSIRPTGSIAYKLGLVSAGLADATWTLSPKHEWDVVAGVALVRSSGGRVSLPGNAEFQFNRKETLLPGLVASSEGIWGEVNCMLAEVARSYAGADRGTKPAEKSA